MPMSGFIISKIGPSKVTVIGAVITTISLTGNLIFHANAIQLASWFSAPKCGPIILTKV